MVEQLTRLLLEKNRVLAAVLTYVPPGPAMWTQRGHSASRNIVRHAESNTGIGEVVRWLVAELFPKIRFGRAELFFLVFTKLTICHTK